MIVLRGRFKTVARPLKNCRSEQSRAVEQISDLLVHFTDFGIAR
jgi:hypothetical protein